MDSIRYYQIDGMVCYACAGIIESTAKKCPGVTSANVNFVTESLVINTNDTFDEDSLLSRIENRGYRIIPADGNTRKIDLTTDLQTDRKRIYISFALSVLLWLCVIFRISGWIQLIFATVIQIIAGIQFYKDAYRAVLSKTPNMSLLVTIGTVSTFLFSLFSLIFGKNDTFFEASGTVLVFLLIGKYLEKSAKNASSDSLKELMDVFQKNAVRIRDGKQENVEISDIRKDDVLLIPGNSIFPIDGVIIKGYTEVDESKLTGESRIIRKEVGDSVKCGTINYNHIVTVRADCAQEDSLYARMISAMLRSMDGKRADIQRLADRISAYFIPTILGLAIFALGLWFAFLRPGDLYKAVSVSVSVMVAACPCALGIAVPLAVTEAIGVLGKSGIIIKDPAALEQLSDVRTFIFDKTGTLTVGSDDVLREGAPVTVSVLKKKKNRTVLLSGDSNDRVKAAAEACGIEEYYALLSPEGKHELLNSLKNDGKIAMLGDGVNDLLCLASADVGLSIGYAADMNFDTADIILTQNKITHLLKALFVSKKMMKIARQSILWVFAYNIAAVTLAVLGILTPAFAGVAMSLSSVIVVLNANRLKKECGSITFQKVIDC